MELEWFLCAHQYSCDVFSLFAHSLISLLAIAAEVSASELLLMADSLNTPGRILQACAASGRRGESAGPGVVRTLENSAWLSHGTAFHTVVRSCLPSIQWGCSKLVVAVFWACLMIRKAGLPGVNGLWELLAERDWNKRFSTCFWENFWLGRKYSPPVPTISCIPYNLESHRASPHSWELRSDWEIQICGD